MKVLHCLPLLCLFGASAQAADVYPSKPITLIVPVPPGGANDFVARLAGDVITSQSGQQVIISNRGGAGGLIGMSAAAKATPDGYTLIAASSGQITSTRLMFRDPMVDPMKDLEPIAPVIDVQIIAAIHKDVAAKTLADFVAMAKSQPGAFNYTSGGTGSGSHLAGDQLLRQLGLNLPHIAYKGAGPAITDVVGGRVQMIVLSPGSLLPHIRSGALRPLAVASNKRIPFAPDIPTAPEAGAPSWNVSVWFGLFGPRGLPKEIIDRINGYVQALANDPAAKKRVADGYMELMPMSAEDFGRFVRDDATKWEKIIKDAGIKPQ
jgi:tripartite-type tricarboxylate transporter receptor subunit TctC